MGEVKVNSFEPDLNRSVKTEFSDNRITSNAGVLLLREADSRLKLIDSIAKRLIDTRNQSAIRYQLGDLLGDPLLEGIYAMALGYSAQYDVDRLAHDPAFRIAVWNRPGDNMVNVRLASQPPDLAYCP
ncbi:MAG: transposase [Pirellula sp.]